MSEEFRNKFNYDLDLSKPRELSSNDFEGMIKTPYSKEPLYSPIENSSKALISAMKALQEKIKTLENDLFEAKDHILALESKHANDREKWQTRLIEEIQMTKERENYLQIKVYEYEDELKKLAGKVSYSEEQGKIKEIQCKHLENEVKRINDQVSVDFESLNMQIEYLQKNLNAKTVSEKKTQKTLENALRDKELAEEELKQQKRINTGLQSEVSYLRENSDIQRNSIQKNNESLQHELTQQNNEFLQKIKELEIKNKSLRDLNHNQSQQILHLKKEIADLTKINEASSSSKLEIIKTKSVKNKIPTNSIPKTNSRRSVSPSIRNNYETSKTLKKESPKDLKKQINVCEKEIDKLSNSYRDLINMSSQGSGDMSSLRREMSKLATDIEKKNEELYNYKKKQQEFLREKLMN